MMDNRKERFAFRHRFVCLLLICGLTCMFSSCEKDHSGNDGNDPETPELPEQPGNGNGGADPEQPEQPGNGNGGAEPEQPEQPGNGNGNGEPWSGVNFTQADVDIVKLHKIYFGHKSVGYNIVAGIRRISDIHILTAYNQPDQNDGSLRTTILQLTGGPAFVEHDIGSDGRPFDKIASFERFMNDIIRDNVDVAFFKFCYMDIDASTDVSALIAAYQAAIDRLHTCFPKVIIAHFTVPLYSRPASFDNNKREQFSNWLRETYKDKVFDIASIESVDSKGNTAISWDNATIAMADEWTDDGGHLNEAGQNQISGALIAFLAQFFINE